MKTLKESLLDDEEDLISTVHFEDPKYFKELLSIANSGKWGTSNLNIEDIILLCKDIYNSNFGETMTDEDCEILIKKSHWFFLEKIENKSSLNYIFDMLNKILRANKGLFGVASPGVKNNYDFDDPETYMKKSLPYPGLKDAWNELFDLLHKVNKGKIKPIITDIMDELGMLNKSVESYKNCVEYKVALHNTPLRHWLQFYIIWIPSTLPDKYKKILKILLAELN